MSHFIGLVFVPMDTDLETMLAPFNEQDETYMEFVDKTDEVEQEYAKLLDSCPKEGTFIDEIDRTDLVNEIWDNAKDKLEEEDEESFWQPYTKDKYPTPMDIAEDKGYKVVVDETKRGGVRFVQEGKREWKYVPSREKYPTLDAYAQNYCGYRKLNGRYGYMSNPNGKYDYYSEGGRWANEILRKDGTMCNSEYIENIDWERMFSEGRVPYVIVDNEGVWHERGGMGWFGIGSNEKSHKDWDKEAKSYVDKMLSDSDEDMLVVAVDFHI